MPRRPLRAAPALLLALVVAAMLVPTFALGEPPVAPLVPDCTGAPPGLVDAPPLAKRLDVDEPFTSPATNGGALPGAGSVSPTGEYTYRIPVEVPAGRAGMQPALALSYNSRGQNGYAGVGWQLEGFSEITRCPKTLATEAVSDGVFFTADDALCLDGQKLVDIGPHTDTNGCAGTEYRTELDSFARVFRGCGRFEVWLKDGRIRSYSPIQPAAWDTPLAWVIASERDRSGNSIDYHYDILSGGFEYRPARIDYGHRRIELAYTDRPDPTSFVVGLRGSSPVRLDVTTKLYAITAYAPRLDDVDAREVAWRYELFYEDVPIAGSGRSRVVAVRRCGALGGCSLAKQFAWESHRGPEYVETIAPLTPIEAQNFVELEADPTFSLGLLGAPLAVADLDGDGRDDLILGRVDGSAFHVRTTTHLVDPLGETRPVIPSFPAVPRWGASRIADLDGDGRDEIIVPLLSNGGEYRILSLAGSLLDPIPDLVDVPIPQQSWSASQGPTLFTVDLDGDGLSDIVSADGVGGWTYRRNLGGLAFDTAAWSGFSFDPLFPAPVAMDTGHRRATVFVTRDPYYTLKGFRLTGDGGAVEQEAMDIEVEEPGERRVLADVDGDSVRDDLRFLPSTEWIEPTDNSGLRTVKHRATLRRGDDSETVEVSWVTGVPPVSVEEPRWDIQVADLDGNGQEDVLVTYLWRDPASSPGAPLTSRAFLFSLDRSAHLEQRALAVPRPRAIGDFDGDGLLDLLSVEPHGFGLAFHIHRQTGIGTNDRIVAVTDQGDDDPEHAREKVSYSTSWSPDPAPAACAHPQRCMKHGFAVVREHDVYQGSESIASSGTQYQRTLYNYEDPRFDVRGRGFLGFGTVRSWEVNRVAETVVTYDNETSGAGVYPGAHLPKRILRAVALPDGDARVTLSNFVYEQRPLHGGKTHAVFPTDWSVMEWEEPVTLDLDASAQVHIQGIEWLAENMEGRRRFGGATYDDHGNVLDAYALTVGGAVTHVVSTYEIREDDWLVGLLKTQESTSAAVPTVARHVEHDYDARGLLCHTHVEKNHPSPDIPEVFTYFHDGEGLIRAVTTTAAGKDPRTTHVAYDAAERVYPSRVWNDLGHVRATVRHPGLGVVLAAEDENGVRTQRHHDEFGRLLTSQREDRAMVSVSYERRLDGLGAVVGMDVEVTDEFGGFARTSHDELGRVVARRHLGFDGDEIEQTLQYDTLGRVARVSRPGLGVASGLATLFGYDNLDRLTRELRPGDGLITFEHKLFETLATDPMGHQRRVRRDVDGRTAAVDELTPAGTLRTAYEYGDFGQLVRTIDPHDNEIVVGYDARGRRISLDDPDAGLTQFQYNGFGELVQTLANGAHPRTFRYDELGRVTSVEDDDGQTTTVWDGALNGVGRVSHTQSPDGTTQDFEYDDFGQVRAQSWTIDGHTYRFDFWYDRAGRIDVLEYPEVPGRPRFMAAHAYNHQGYLKRVSSRQGGSPDASLLWTTDSRNVDGMLGQATLGNGDVLTRTYYPETGRLRTLASGSALSLEYTYDYDGNVVARDDLVHHHRDDFTYDDALHRLTKWRRLTDAGPERKVEYGYDALGNLTTVLSDGQLDQLNVYAEDQRPHALTSNQAGAYIYDDRGRQVVAPSREVAFTEFDLPRSVNTVSGTTSFAYDAAQRRVKKTGPSGTTITLGGLYERRESAGSVTHVFHVQGPEGPVAQAVYTEGAGTTAIEYLHLDALGSVNAITNAGGVERLDYEPFGGRQSVTGGPAGTPTGDVRLGFTGHRHDDDLGLIDMRGRVYDPANRRFLTPDPHVTNPMGSQSYNRYSYVVNNPVNLTDPTGFDWWGGGCLGLECFGGGGIYGTGFGFGFGMSFGGPSGGNWMGTPNPYPGVPFGPRARSVGAPTQATEHLRPTSVPVGPSAPSMSVMGPPWGLAWANPTGSDFYREIALDLAELIARNNELWYADAPIRAFKERLAGDPDLREFVETQWRILGGSGPVPFEFAVDVVEEQDIYNTTMQMVMSTRASIKGVGGMEGAAAALRPTFLNRGDPTGGKIIGTLTKSGRQYYVGDELATGTFDYVVRNGEITIGSKHYVLGGGGLPVGYAGSITLEKGVILRWNNASGHYRPSAVFAPNAGLPMESFQPAKFPMLVGPAEIPVYRSP